MNNAPISTELNLKSARAHKARLSGRINKNTAALAGLSAALLGIAALYSLAFGELPRLGYLALSLAAFCAMLAFWHRYDLRDVPPHLPPKQLDDILEPELLAHLPSQLTPRSAWDAAAKNWQTKFLCNHLLLHPDSIADGLSPNEHDMQIVWNQALDLMTHTAGAQLGAGTLAAALLISSPAIESFLTQNKLGKADVVEVHSWLERQIGYMNEPKPYFGGIGRDWAMGFTPKLDQFGQNISANIEHNGGYKRFISHADVVTGIVNNLERGSAVALVGPAGVGKTELVYALADHLLEGKAPNLQYYQIFSLNASAILSASGHQLESMMLNLFGEAVMAGNIILFLDEAQLFFGSGVGAFDMSQLLLPVLKNRRLKIIASFAPNDWQRLRTANESLASGFAPVMVGEPTPEATLKVLEDSSIMLERRNNLLVSYEAIREAYRLSGQYMQEDSYPGKALNLLEQAVPYANDKVLWPETVQSALEKMRGVRVSQAAAPEADMLLHLEDRIHERMINQVAAVNVIASALRRGRAGVANPKRPVGSFLFLGPTGVGKTELARSLASVYFGDEHQMVRLDMSEYQRPEDVTRLLATGAHADHSLLMSIRQQPFAVVLLDEVEKAHPNILNLLLQMLDEGQLTDEAGKPASFRSAIIIATSNAGATDIIERVRAGGGLDDTFERPLVNKLISSGQFKPELINRFDEVVLFRPLNLQEMTQVAQLMLGEVNRTLANQNISVQLTPAALQAVATAGYDPEFGARPMRRIIQKTVENAVAVKILGGQASAGSVITLDVPDLALPNAAVAPPNPSSQ
ncbi:MAG TPA: AAA family ATPase [Nevskiaceae bacterium]|nr:AAA family ATPase [Nevskiaceae bacterium]